MPDSLGRSCGSTLLPCARGSLLPPSIPKQQRRSDKQRDEEPIQGQDLYRPAPRGAQPEEPDRADDEVHHAVPAYGAVGVRRQPRGEAEGRVGAEVAGADQSQPVEFGGHSPPRLNRPLRVVSYWLVDEDGDAVAHR